MDFFALPPEVNSARMYAGPGSGPLVVAASAWQELAAELQRTASGYTTTLSGLTSQAWLGPSSASMLSATAPYIEWLTTTATQADATAMHALAASCFEESCSPDSPTAISAI